jgi:aldose 1-epimerase
MSIEKKSFGTLGTGEDISLYIMKAGEYAATFTDYGAILVSLLVPDRRGQKADVTLGFSTLSGYAGKHPFFGATVGRYGNRIGAARFSLDGREFILAANNGENHLHGGIKGFDKQIWSASILCADPSPSLRFSRTSPDGEEGYPGTLDVSVCFSLDASGSLSIRYEARTDAKTIVNLTNHSYFNLKGEGRGNVLDHSMRLACSRMLPVGPGQIPTGELADVAGGPFDFRSPATIGERIGLTSGGYDHNYVLDRAGSGLVEFAEVYEAASGRRMKVSTTLPGCQFYSGNSIPLISGKRGSLYDRHSGFCLETQFFPDSPNQPSFPSASLEAGQLWAHETVYSFSV